MYHFDLDQSVATWKRSLRLNRAFLREDLDELEGHLRDHVEQLIAGGCEPREAYRQAVSRLGNYGELESEYQKVRFGPSKRKRSVLRDSVWTVAMLRNYLTIASRNLVRHRFYAGLNIAGLALGLASCLLILLYVTDEVRFDRFHERADQIYRVNWDFKWNGNQDVSSGSPPPLAAALVDEIPGIRETTRVFPAPNTVVRRDDLVFSETKIFGVDSTFFNLFSFPLMEGDPATSLAAPGSVVLTESMARKYFGEAQALGESIRIGEDQTLFAGSYHSDFRVTGIVEDPPATSHFDFDMLTSMSSYPQVSYFDWSWIWMQVVTYAVVEDAAAIPDLEARITNMVADRAPPAFTRVGFSYPELLESGGYWNFVFQPLTDIHLGSGHAGNRLGPTGSRTNLNIFMVVALFILGIACINSMNLATARSSNRANEVGVRKVLGSDRRSLMSQFLMESMLFSALAMLLALALAAVFLGPFNQIAGKSIRLTLLNPGWLPFALVGLTIFVGALTGSYPSLYLSAFKPVQVLKGGAISGRKGRRFRNGLVVLQFSISIALIICTLLIRNQMVFLREADMGFDKEGILVISNQNRRLGDQVESFKGSIKGLASVANVSVSTSVPSSFAFQDYYKIEGRGDEQWDLASYLVDDDFTDTIGLEIVEGRGFSGETGSGADGVILNQEAVRRFGWEDPIGKIITYPSVGDFHVIGVVRDFNFRSLQVSIDPFALFHESSKSYTIPDGSILVRLGTGDFPATLAQLEDEWNAVAPDAPFEYSFLDERIDAQYGTERRLERLFLIFAGLAIIIACLGLWGLAAFSAEKRTKEIGIRKSLGASVAGVLGLLVRDLTKWVVMANLIAWPFAWWWANRWLEGFAFRVGIGLAPFVWAGGTALLIAFLTVGYQAARTARSNPVEALRYE
jgi:putative ABC transport system permease protein